MDGQYWKGDQTMSTREWLLTSDFWQFLKPWHGRWYFGLNIEIIENIDFLYSTDFHDNVQFRLYIEMNFLYSTYFHDYVQFRLYIEINFLYSIYLHDYFQFGLYWKVSNIRRTESQNLNDSRLVLLLSVPNPLKPSVKSIMKM